MTEPSWLFCYFESARDRWVADYDPPVSVVLRVCDWRSRVQTYGLDEGTVTWGDDEHFVVRIPKTRVVVSGRALASEYLLIVGAIHTLQLVVDDNG